jgi:hypothetical protein
MKLILNICLLLVFSKGFSQTTPFDITHKYTVHEVLEDIDYTEKYLIKFHPDPFRYITKDSLQAFVVRIKSKIDTPLTEMQVRFYLRQIVAKIGCGHTDVSNSKAYSKAIEKLNRPIFPFNAFVVDTNRVFILNNLSGDSTIKAGDEILSIDHHAIPGILARIGTIFTTDGYNQTYKKQGIKNEWFKYYYSFCYGFHTPYLLGLKHTNGTVSQHTISAISSQKDTVMLPKRDSVIAIQKTKTCTYFLAKKDTTVAVIDVNSFGGKHWRRFMRRSFKDIKRKKITNLVIDLRDNGGGKIDNGMNLLAYLIHKPMVVSFDRKPNLLPLNFKYKMNFFSRLTPLFFAASPLELPRHWRLRHYIVHFPKYRNAYHGKLSVLINGKSFSMSAIAAAYLKYKANATIVGEETGGNIAGSNAVVSGTIILPNTKARVFIPYYHIYHSIDVINNGHGLMPDIKTTYSANDVLQGIDVDLNKVLEMKLFNK